MVYDTVIRSAWLVDGQGSGIYKADVALQGDRIVRIAESIAEGGREQINAEGLYLAPGFIDVHTHDDIEVIERPQMLAKISQGVTSVIVGNCGISASPVVLNNAPPPDPLNLLGDSAAFNYPQFSNYAEAVKRAAPAVNVAALIGHTAIRNNHLHDLQRPASAAQRTAMATQLREALAQGALGLSSGLAYSNALQADSEEVLALVAELQPFGGIYVTHLRDEFDQILEAIDEALTTAAKGQVPLVISHLKCAGKGNWGRSKPILARLQQAASVQRLACDCYPYTASSSTLDLKQVSADSDVFITWSQAAPEQGGRPLADIAREWGLSLYEAAQKLQPAGAVYHCMSSDDVEAILSHPLSMIGSDGLPKDPHPHPRLWGTFPKVIAHYCRDRGLFDLPTAVHKMTGRSAEQFRLAERGLIAEGYFADLVLFDLPRLQATATYEKPVQAAEGIERVWVNGALGYLAGGATGARAGRFLYRTATP